MTSISKLNQLYSTKLVGLDHYFNEIINLFKSQKLPNILLLNGKKGIGKFTLIMHFINYIFSKNEVVPYNLKNKTINTESLFYNSLLNNTLQDVIFIHAEENKNIKIEDIRSLKSTISNSSLSNNPRFIIIDEVEFLNTSSVNALLKTLEEPSDNNFFILINNQQSDLIETISSRCIKSNIYLNQEKKNEVINYLIEDRNIDNLIDLNNNLSPGLFLKFNEIYLKLKITKDDNILIKLNALITAYKKEKVKDLISLSYFLIDHYFFYKIIKNKHETESLLNTKSHIIEIIHNFVTFNLNINTVLNSIKIKLNNV